MENKKQTEEVVIGSYDVFNALNLVNEELGQSYLQNGFNPFESNFVLSEDYVVDTLKNKKLAPELQTPDFIEKGTKATKKAFDLSKQNCLNLLESLLSLLNNPNLTPEQKAKLANLIAQLKMFLELLSINTKKLSKEKNALKMYYDMLAINWYLAFLQQSFVDALDAKAIATNLLGKMSVAEKSEESQKLQEQARQIIADNLKKQELLEKAQAEKVIEENKQPTKSQIPAKEKASKTMAPEPVELTEPLFEDAHKPTSFDTADLEK
ncbi:MAG: hypothetical protein E7378_02830 [Clostridiales bacterium]|nr:hypothetical protein [Clostridiales bacterium]